MFPLDISFIIDAPSAISPVPGNIEAIETGSSGLSVLVSGSW